MKTLLIATAFVLTFAPVCFAQEQTEAEREAARQKSPDSRIIVIEEDSARITTDMEKKQYGGDEDFVLHINLKNVGTKDFFNKNVRFSDKVYDFYEIEVVDQVGRKVPRLKITELSWTNGPEGWGLKPGQTLKATVWLNNLFDFQYGGKFKVTVSKIFRRDGKLITISAEPVEFEITSAKMIANWTG